MEDFLNHPAVQGGIAPFVVALIVVLILHRFRLGGLALVAALATTVYFVAGFTFSPLTATRKIFLLGLAAPVIGVLADKIFFLSLAAPVIGVLADFAFKPTRIGALVLALAGAAAALWVFWPLLQQKGAGEAWLLGGTIAFSVAWLVGTGMLIAEDPVRAGAAGFASGMGAGIAAIFGASVTYFLYGIALGAGAGAFLLVQMITGKKYVAGATFMLSATLVAGLIGAGGMILAKVPWYAVLVLAFIPLATLLPTPKKAPVWAQAVLLSLYGLVVAGVACYLSWQSGGATSG